MKKSIITLIIILLNINFLISQNTKNKVWVVVESTIPTQKGIPLKSTNPNINKLFKKFNVSSYEQALPFAKTQKLKKVYEITCNCNTEDLATEITQKYSKSFSAVKILEEEQNIALYEPVDYMWTAFADTWLWHLKRIEAELGIYRAVVLM